MASISPTSLACPAEPHTGHGAYLNLEITSITDSDASTNKRYIGWKITFNGTPWVQLYKAYCTLGETVLYSGEPNTTGWSVGTILANNTTTFSNDSAGNLSLSAYIKQLFFYGTWAWDRSGYYQEASTTMICSQLPRYANITSHTASTGLNKVTISYSADANYTSPQYSLDGGAWTNCSTFSYSIGGFTPGTTHSIKTRIKRVDSGLWTTSGALSFKLKSLPTSNNVSDVNFNSSGTRVDVSISSKDYLSSWYVKLYDGNTLLRDASDNPNTGSSASDYWNINSSNSVGMLPRHGSDNEWNLTAQFYVVSNGTTYQLATKTFKCKLPSNLYLPTYNTNNISYDVTDAKTLNLTNNNTKKVIKGVSNVQITSTAATPNGSASMASYVATSGTKSNSTSNTTAPITINLTAVDGSSVVVQAIDSRNRSTSATKQYDTFIDYFSPVIESASVNRIDGIGTNLSVNITGRYCNWSGLATNNTITQVSLKYRIKGDQNWTTISGVNLTMSVGNGNFTITGNITGNLFNAVNEYEVLLTFEDKIGEFSYQPTIPPGQAFVWRDMTNKRLGINKKPDYSLDVAGDIKASERIYTDKQFVNENQGTWIDDRNIATTKNTSDGGISAYAPVVSQKTKNGNWTIGAVANADDLYFNYTTDSNFSSSTNLSQRCYIKEGTTGILATLQMVYPVGSIYITTVNTNPTTLFGGTWVQIKDTFLLACGSTYSNGATGGEATHKLTVNEMPSHNHVIHGNTNIGSASGSGYWHFPTAIEGWAYGSYKDLYENSSGTNSNGGNQAHNNMPPYLAVYVWKRTA